MISVIDQWQSPKFTQEIIPVEFLILHYTACTTEQTLKLFCHPDAKVCAHFVVDPAGHIYDLGHFWKKDIRRGAHAGRSRIDVDGRHWEELNRCSIGVEIVNLNGNLIDYPDAQYVALAHLSRHLLKRFPTLSDPNRVMGHEHIAGFRGKADPGLKFDWRRYFESVYPEKTPPNRSALFTSTLLQAFEERYGTIEINKLKQDDWPKLSTQMETFLAEHFSSH